MLGLINHRPAPWERVQQVGAVGNSYAQHPSDGHHAGRSSAAVPVGAQVTGWSEQRTPHNIYTIHACTHALRGRGAPCASRREAHNTYMCCVLRVGAFLAVQGGGSGPVRPATALLQVP